MRSLEDILYGSSRALVIGVGGGGDVVGALVTARLLETCGVAVTLGGLSWENPCVDPVPGPRSLDEVLDVDPIHRRVWRACPQSRTTGGVLFAESRLAGLVTNDVLLIDINGGVTDVVDGLRHALRRYDADLLVGIDVGGDSLARGSECGLRSPLADSIMLAAFGELEGEGQTVLWGMFGYGSDGELSCAEIESALATVAAADGLLGAWGLTHRVLAELAEVVRHIPTEASAVPVACARGQRGPTAIRGGTCPVVLTPLTTLTFFMTPRSVLESVSQPGQAVRGSVSLEQANDALHGLGIRTELDIERGLSVAS